MNISFLLCPDFQNSIRTKKVVDIIIKYEI